MLKNIYQKVGKHATAYEVSILNLINIYDLGPNTKRIITLIYGESKQTPIKQIIFNKNLLNQISYQIWSYLTKTS